MVGGVEAEPEKAAIPETVDRAEASFSLNQLQVFKQKKRLPTVILCFKGSKPHIRCYTWSRGAIYAQPFYQKEGTSGPSPAY